MQGTAGLSVWLLVLGKVMEHSAIFLNATMQHIQDTQVIRPTQRGFMKGRSCLANLITFYVKVMHLVHEAKTVDVVCLDFRKAFDTVSHSPLLEKLAAHGLDRCTLCWVKNWLSGQAQTVVVLNPDLMELNPVGGQWHQGAGVCPKKDNKDGEGSREQGLWRATEGSWVI